MRRECPRQLFQGSNLQADSQLQAAVQMGVACQLQVYARHVHVAVQVAQLLTLQHRLHAALQAQGVAGHAGRQHQRPCQGCVGLAWLAHGKSAVHLQGEQRAQRRHDARGEPL